MAYIDNSIYLNRKSASTETTLTVATTSVTNKTDEPIYNYRANTTQTNTQEKYTPQERIIQIRNINKKALKKQYKDNPIGIIKVLQLEFNDKQINQLQAMLSDSKSIEQFLNIIDKDNLTAEDIIATIEHERNRKSSNWLKRGWIYITKGRAEHEINADNFSREISEIRESRQDLSTNFVVSLADDNETLPETKEARMHFVEAKTPQGKAIYSEENIQETNAYINKSPQKAEDLVDITKELESILDADGNPKYTGTTMINVGKRSVENPKLRETNLRAAHKKDMTDEFLENITRNLFDNPDMQGVIDYSLNAKNKDGSDKFSAGNINDESNQLVDKSGGFCNDYLDNLKTLSQYNNLSSDDIVKITENITTHPEIYNDVISKLESGTMSGSEVAEYSSQCAKAAENGTYESNNNNAAGANSTTNFESNSSLDAEKAQNGYKPIESKTDTNSVNKNNSTLGGIFKSCEVTNPNEYNNSNTVKIDGNYYALDKLENELYKQFGTISKSVLNKIINDPAFVEKIKRYGNNKKIIEALIKTPELIDKINSAAGALSNKERAEILGLCTDARSTNIMLNALQSSSVTEAIRTTHRAQITNSKYDTLSILTATNKSNTRKKHELKQLYGINDNCNYVA